MPDTRGFNCNGAESQVAERVAALKRKQDDILGRVTELERRCASTSAGTPSASRSFDYLSSNMTSTLVMNCNGAESQVAERVAALQRKQDDILARIAELERRCASNSTVAPFAPMDISPVQRRLAEELAAEGIVNHRFVRAPPEYYDQTLEFRQAVLQAASVHHLCKTIIMENTRVEAREEGIHKYYMVIVQYSAKLHSDKLRQFVQASHNGRLSKSRINMRLCPEAVSDELSGFEHNAVSPIGIKTRLPIIMSHRIAQLNPDFFWLGAGEVDLKVGLSAAEFVEKYHPHVVDCTYD